MEKNDFDEEEYGFSRNYFLAKESSSSSKKSSHKVSDIEVVDEQVIICLVLTYDYYGIQSCRVYLRIQFVLLVCKWLKELIAAVCSIEPKHEKEVSTLKDSYKSSYDEWVFQLRYVLVLSREAFM